MPPGAGQQISSGIDGQRGPGRLAEGGHPLPERRSAGPQLGIVAVDRHADHQLTAVGHAGAKVAQQDGEDGEVEIDGDPLGPASTRERRRESHPA